MWRYGALFNEKLRAVASRLDRLSIPQRIGVGLLALVLAAGLFYYFKYSWMIERHVRSAPAAGNSLIYAAPPAVVAGARLTMEEVVDHLRRNGYADTPSDEQSWYAVRGDLLEVHPGPYSPLAPYPAVLRFTRGGVSRITLARDGTLLSRYHLEPEVLSNLTGANREKRRPVQFSQIPKVLVNALVSIEDKRFFSHAGFDPLRTLKAAYIDLRERKKEQGASTLSMQLARSLWLEQKKTWRRKAVEVFMALQLERRYSKEQIFEFYANQIYLGRRGTFNIHGFGEAAHVYFGKDVRDLTLPEAALLAGMVQRPAWLNPFRNPDRALARRNLVLAQMKEAGHITEQERAAAAASPLGVTAFRSESSDAPYFVDLVNDDIQSRFTEDQLTAKAFRIYTTLDVDVQRAAVEAVRVGMAEVDKQLRSKRKKVKKGEPPPAEARPQVALVALDPETGEVKALVGGRDYNESQLNRALAKRQPGSVFKPFVYAAALAASLNGGPSLTAASVVTDEPTTFQFGNEIYEPGNFGDIFNGRVAMRQALIKSLNIPTVKIAQQVGYKTVADLAKRAGLNANIRGTPSVALGAYEVTPLEMAGAYTLFARQGAVVRPNWIEAVRTTDAQVVYAHQPAEYPVMDRRPAYIVLDMLQDVLRIGTGAAVRSRGFTLPAAGKTGTSHDGWFAGFTTRLLCVVWVGYDDNRELELEGSKSALPVWVEFMKRAHALPAYRDAKEFPSPPGMVRVGIDGSTGKIAGPYCPYVRNEVFIAGTQPREACVEHDSYEYVEHRQPSGNGRNVFQKIWGIFR